MKDFNDKDLVELIVTSYGKQKALEYYARKLNEANKKMRNAISSQNTSEAFLQAGLTSDLIDRLTTIIFDVDRLANRQNNIV